MPDVSPPYHGQCACGTVRYTLGQPPLFLHACHCTDCQRLSGGPFGLTMVVVQADLHFLSGELTTTAIRGGSGALKTAFRCKACGSNVYGRSQSMPGCASLRPGTLIDVSWFTPQAHIWTRSRQHWVQLPPDVPAFDEHYDRAAVWPLESLQRLSAALAASS